MSADQPATPIVYGTQKDPDESTSGTQVAISSSCLLPRVGSGTYKVALVVRDV